jgi:hypothetical protein
VALSSSTSDALGLAGDLRDDERALHITARLALRDAPLERRLVVLIDQFEEVFTLCRNIGLRQALINNLLYAASVTGGQTVVLLALRADFYGKCAAYPTLAAALSDHQLLVGSMTERELRRAIERPAQLAGLEFEGGLVDILLRDVQAEPGALPLLQHTLLELWGRREGRRMTFAAYREIGGVQGAIAHRAEETYTVFTPEERKVTRSVLLRLTQPGEGTEDTRRRAGKAELIPDPTQAEAVEGVVQKLTDARLLTTARDEETDQEVVDVAHEALIQGWPRLRRWIDEDRAFLRIHRRLTEIANEWRHNGRDESFLYRGARLAEIEEWAQAHTDELNPLEQEFLNASLELRRLDLIREASEVVSSSPNLDRAFEVILDELQRIVPYDSATLQVLHGSQLVIAQGRGWENLEEIMGLAIPVAGNPQAAVVDAKSPHVVSDARADYAIFREPPYGHTRSWLGVPLLSGDDLLGIIALDGAEPDYFTHEHAQLALTFANHVAVALQNAQLFEQARQYADRLRVINEVGVDFTSILNVDELVARVSRQAEETFGYRVTIALIEEDYLVWRTLEDQEDGEDQESLQGEGGHV